MPFMCQIGGREMKRGFVIFPALVLAFSLVLIHVSGVPCQGCDPENRVSTATLVPPDYAGFQPPPMAQPYVDPTFCTEIRRLTDSQAGYLTNSEQAFFNIDDSYFLASENNIGYLWDGEDGHRIKEIGGGSMRPWWIRWPRANYYTASGVKHTFDPTEHFYKYEGNEVRLYSVQTLDHVVIRKFTEYTETRPACGDVDGDGVDEIVIGLGSGGAGWVEVFEYGGQGLTHRDWVRVRYQAYNGMNGETRPACGDVDGDGKVLVAPHGWCISGFDLFCEYFSGL